MAEGGKSEEGVRKEKRALSRLDWPFCPVAVAPWRGWAERSEKKVKKIGKATQAKSRRTSRGGRILAPLKGKDRLWLDADDQDRLRTRERHPSGMATASKSRPGRPKMQSQKWRMMMS